MLYHLVFVNYIWFNTIFKELIHFYWISTSTPKSFSAGLLSILSTPDCTDSRDCPNLSHLFSMVSKWSCFSLVPCVLCFRLLNGQDCHLLLYVQPTLLYSENYPSRTCIKKIFVIYVGSLLEWSCPMLPFQQVLGWLQFSVRRPRACDLEVPSAV